MHIPATSYTIKAISIGYHLLGAISEIIEEWKEADGDIVHTPPIEVPIGDKNVTIEAQIKITERP